MPGSSQYHPDVKYRCQQCVWGYPCTVATIIVAMNAKAVNHLCLIICGCGGQDRPVLSWPAWTGFAASVPRGNLGACLALINAPTAVSLEREIEELSRTIKYWLYCIMHKWLYCSCLKPCMTLLASSALSGYVQGQEIKREDDETRENSSPAMRHDLDLSIKPSQRLRSYSFTTRCCTATRT